MQKVIYKKFYIHTNIQFALRVTTIMALSWAHDVRLHIVGLQCGVTRVLKLRSMSNA